MQVCKCRQVVFEGILVGSLLLSGKPRQTKLLSLRHQLDASSVPAAAVSHHTAQQSLRIAPSLQHGVQRGCILKLSFGRSLSAGGLEELQKVAECCLLVLSACWGAGRLSMSAVMWWKGGGLQQ